MAKKTKKHTKSRNKHVATKPKGPAAVKVAKRVRAQASRRTAEGKFNKIVFRQIGGKECPLFAAMTWVERDQFMAKPENAAVRERYEKHMASVGGK